MFDIEAIRKDFPILKRLVNNKPLVYFDNSATTQKPQQVIDKIVEGYTTRNANIHRGVHTLSQEATEAHEEARKETANFINARSSKEIIFTRGTTESINLVASTFVEGFMNAGDEVIVSTMEHHSNIVPWQIQGSHKDVHLKVIPITDKGELDLEAYKKLFNKKTKIVSVTHVSNVLGTINPVKQIIKIAHEHHIPVLLDAAQSIAHIPTDVLDLDADFLAFSGHKIYAPNGIGVLYGKSEWLTKLPPYQGGGEMIDSVTFEETTFNELPFKYEAGTPDYVGSTALAEALRYVKKRGIENILTYENELLSYATTRLKEISGVRIYGESEHKSAVLSFLVRDIHPYDMGMLLDQLGIAVRTGHHCAQPLHHRFGIEGTVRASFAFYNTKEEIDLFIEALKRICKMF